MKKIFFVSIILFFFVKSSVAQTDSAYDSIALLNLDHYASKPVDSFLHRIPSSYNYFQLMGHTKGDKVKGLAIRYPTGMTILIYPKVYAYMNPVDSNHVWDIVLFKKETAGYITVIHPDFNPLTGEYP